MNNRPKIKKEASLSTAIARGAVLVLFDAFFLNQGAASALVGIVIVLVGLPMAILKKPYSARAARFRNLGIYILAVVMVFTLNIANNRLAQHRAESLVAAITSFHQKYHRYPKTLDNLVPEYIDHVPLAKYTLTFNSFFYYAGDDGDAILYYVDLPPFGHPIYDFKIAKWDYDG